MKLSALIADLTAELIREGDVLVDYVHVVMDETTLTQRTVITLAKAYDLYPTKVELRRSY